MPGLSPNSKKPMNKHQQHRAWLLQEADRFPNDNLHKGSRTPYAISEADFAAVPPPVNLRVQPAGDCLIWVGRLNDDGYGAGTFPAGETLAHRQAFAQSRKSEAGCSVLHLCSHPFCVQPSHLYEGGHQDNSDDRQLRLGKDMGWAKLENKAAIVQRVARYRWNSPATGLQPSLALKTAEVKHDCKFIIPAGDYHICDTCGQPEPEWLREHTGPRELQPADKDTNSFSLVKQARSLTNVAEGVVIDSHYSAIIDMPKSRAERRRRDRERRKQPNRPVLLGSHTIDPTKPTGTVSFNHPPLHGPGIVLTILRPSEREAFRPERQKPDARRLANEFLPKPERLGWLERPSQT